MITLLIIIFIFVLYYQYSKTHYYDVILVKSDIDNNKYLVRDLPDKQLASNMLAKIKSNITTLTNHLVTNKAKFPDYSKYIDQLNERIQSSEILESSDNGIYTSYSVNKGEQLVFCVRSRKDNGKLHDLNMLMYVVLHEISHVACPEIGHTQLFKDIFAFFTTEAINIKIYKHIDFRTNSMEYCGLTISDSIV